MAVSDRVLVLRAGRLVGERATAETDRSELAALMVGQEVDAAAGRRRAEPGPLLLVLEHGLDRRGAARARRSTASRCRCAAARSPASPASPATARRRSPR